MQTQTDTEEHQGDSGWCAFCPGYTLECSRNSRAGSPGGGGRHTSATPLTVMPWTAGINTRATGFRSEILTVTTP